MTFGGISRWARSSPSRGPWLVSDPLVHTANPRTALRLTCGSSTSRLHGLQRAVGFLRSASRSCVLSSAGHRRARLLAAPARAGRSHRRRQRGGTGAFIVLSWWRLIQPRPDLAEHPRGSADLPIAPGGPLRPLSGKRDRGSGRAAVALVWANAHALFSIGLCLIVAALSGLRAGGLPGRASARSSRDRFGAELLSTLAAPPRRAGDRLRRDPALNPSGFAQHLAFHALVGENRRSGMLARRVDCIRPRGLEPRHRRNRSKHGPQLAGLDRDGCSISDALRVSQPAVLLARFLRTRSRSALRFAFDPVLLGLGLAGIAAPLVCDPLPMARQSFRCSIVAHFTRAAARRGSEASHW